MQNYLKSVVKYFEHYRTLGEKALGQVADDGLFWQYNSESNSIAKIVQHLAGNMLSRWTDFLTSDGEKSWRNRDAEFEPIIKNREELLARWNEGWDCMLNTLKSLSQNDLDKLVYIRGEAHSVVDAINRQLAHAPYHVGQIVFIGKMLAGENWHSLSIPRGQSEVFNKKNAGDSLQIKKFPLA